MEHIRVNLTNFVIMGLSGLLFLGGFLYVTVFLASRSIPVLSPASALILRIVNQIPPI